MYTIDKIIKQQVLHLTGLKEQQYAQFIYDCGLAYLQTVINQEDDYITGFISKSEVFWNWWKINWEMRDQEFIEQCYGWNEGQEATQDLYKNNHDPRTLSAALYLNGQVLQNSYAVMIQDLHKCIHAKPVMQ